MEDARRHVQAAIDRDEASATTADLAAFACRSLPPRLQQHTSRQLFSSPNVISAHAGLPHVPAYLREPAWYSVIVNVMQIR